MAIELGGGVGGGLGLGISQFHNKISTKINKIIPMKDFKIKTNDFNNQIIMLNNFM